VVVCLATLRGRPPIKTLTCADLGGHCSKKLSAYTWNAMVEVIAKHHKDKHPKELERALHEMKKKDPEAWAATMKPKWDAAPDQ
jgi:predicted small metal-binding protein